MVRKYSKQIENLPHARKPVEFYLSIFRLRFAGKPVAEIARRLQTTIPTVSMNLTKMETFLCHSKAVEQHMLRLGLATTKDIGRILNGQSRFLDVLSQEESPHTVYDYHSCIANCNFRMRPREFTQKFFLSHHIFDQKYHIEFPIVADDDLLVQYQQKCRDCRFCPMGVGYRDEIINLFLIAPRIYIGYMNLLSQYRTGTMSEMRLKLLYKISLIITQIHSVLQFHISNRLEQEIEEEQIMSEVTQLFEDLTDRVFVHFESQV